MQRDTTQPAPLIILSSDWRAFRFPLPLSQNTHTHKSPRYHICQGQNTGIFCERPRQSALLPEMWKKKQLKWENRVLFFSPLFGIKWWCKIWQEHPAIPCVNKGRLSPSRGLKRARMLGCQGMQADLE